MSFLENFSDDPAVIEGDRRLSFAELNQRIAAVAGWVGERTNPGDVVATMLDNRLECLEILFGVMAAGCRVLPLGTYLPPPALEGCKRLTGAVLTVGLGADLDPSSRSYESELAQAPFGLTPTTGEYILQSGGTDGSPRFSLHDDGLLDCGEVLDWLGFGPQESILATVPAGNGVMVVCARNALMRGTTVILDPRRPTAEVMAELIAAHRPTMLTTVATTMRQIMESEHGFGSVKTVHLGAAPVSPALEAAPVVLWDAYASTEMGLVTVRQAPSLTGTVVPGVEVAIDADGKIWARGPGAMRGQYRASGFVAFDPETWVTSHDYGRLSGDQLGLQGRASDRIMVSGNTVFAARVERVICEVAGVRDVIVAGRPEPKRGEEVVAYVVGDAAEEVILTAVAQRLPAYAVPTIEYRDSVPRTPNGKPLRRELVGT